MHYLNHAGVVFEGMVCVCIFRSLIRVTASLDDCFTDQINKIKVQSKNLNNKDHLFGRLSPRICSSSPDFVVAGRASGKRRVLRVAKVLISGDARTALVRQPR